MMYKLLVFAFYLGSLDVCRSQVRPPSIVEQPQDTVAELDKPMALHCRAESSSLDDLRIEWYKDGRLVTTDPNARIITEFMALHVINTMPQDAGVYYCLAKNSVGQTQSRRARVQFLKLDREFPLSPMSTSASLGEYIRLRCHPPSGSPTPSVHWTKDGKNLSVSLDHHDLVLPSIQRSDFGFYRCIASNGLVRQSAVAQLSEFHPPRISLQPSSSRIDLRRGQSIDLQCSIDNDQYPIEWHYANEIVSTPHLNLSSVEFDQNGIYTCVSNAHNGRRKYRFTKEILVAVHDRQMISEHEERIFSLVNMTVFAGRSAMIDCPLPLEFDEKVLWTSGNHSELDPMQFEYIDEHHSRLKLSRVKQSHHHYQLHCFYSNRIRQQGQAIVQLNVEHLPPPPIIAFAPNNQTVRIGVDVRFSCQSSDETKVQWWFTPNSRPYKLIAIDNNRKYRIETNHDLIVRRVEKNDAGQYKCVLTNRYHDETAWSAQLSVEETRSKVKFQQIERQDLPQAPSPPVMVKADSHSIELKWTSASSAVLDYSIEYFELSRADESALEWSRVLTSNGNANHVVVRELNPGSTYRFLVRARNSFGYGPPSSTLSDVIETEIDRENMNELIHLGAPIDVQGTSVTIQWTLLQTHVVIHRMSIYLNNDRVETIANTMSTYRIANLRANTDYAIRLMPLLAPTNAIGRASNTILVRTLESVPSASPRQILVQVMSTTSLSIRWSPPLDNETNGEIVAYKINCIGFNETSSIRLVNISSDAKGVFVKNLIEHMQYCISLSARTQVGYGPFSQPFCVIMNAEFVQRNHHSFKSRLREAMSQPWFLSVAIISSILFTCALVYALWLCCHYMIRQHHHHHHHHHRMKFASSTSSSNQFVEMPVQKTLSNGKRYNLIKDTPPPLPPSGVPSCAALWMDSLPNGIRLQCCTATTTSGSSHSDHYSMNIHKNPINALLFESRQQQLNPYATTGIFQHHQAVETSMASSPLPFYVSETLHRPPSSTPAQYQSPWLDHPTPSLHYHCQCHTPHHHYPCLHGTCQSHTHTPASVRTVTKPQSPFSHEQDDIFALDPIPITPKFNHPSAGESSDSMMMNSVGADTMITSCTDSLDIEHRPSLSSSSSTNKIDEEKGHQSSSEGSIFSDMDRAQEQSRTSSLVNFERGPSFLIPNM